MSLKWSDVKFDVQGGESTVGPTVYVAWCRSGSDIKCLGVFVTSSAAAEAIAFALGATVAEAEAAGADVDAVLTDQYRMDRHELQGARGVATSKHLVAVAWEREAVETVQ